MSLFFPIRRSLFIFLSSLSLEAFIAPGANKGQQYSVFFCIFFWFERQKSLQFLAPFNRPQQFIVTSKASHCSCLQTEHFSPPNKIKLKKNLHSNVLKIERSSSINESDLWLVLICVAEKAMLENVLFGPSKWPKWAL